MTGITWWQIGLVGLGGFGGAIARFALSGWMSRKFPGSIPYGTLTVNLLGSFLLGAVLAAGIKPLALLLGTGFMGAFTTFSTFKTEGMKLALSRQWRALAIYYGLSYTLGIALAFAGHALVAAAGSL